MPSWSGCCSRPAPTRTSANEDGQTALMLAARTGNVAVAELLVKAGADVNAREQFTRPVGGDVGGGRRAMPEMVAFLVAKGADLSIRATANDWPTQITSEPRVQYRADRRPDAAALRGARGMPRLRADDARSRRGQGPAEPRRHDADDHGARQRRSRASRATCSTRAPTRTPGTGGAARRSTSR